MTRPVLSTFSVRVPFAVRKRGGRKLVITPDGTAERPRPRIDNGLVKAIARSHRWKRMLESGRFASIAELAAAEKIDRSYLCRVLRLTLLAPEIVEAILDGRQPEDVTLPVLMKAVPEEWRKQQASVADRVTQMLPYAFEGFGLLMERGCIAVADDGRIQTVPRKVR